MMFRHGKLSRSKAAFAISLFGGLLAALAVLLGSGPAQGSGRHFVLACRRPNASAQRRCRTAQAKMLELRAAAMYGPNRGRLPRMQRRDVMPSAPYSTAVNPGSAVQFVSSSVGWRVDQIYAAPWLDGLIHSGPPGTSIDWPGGAVSRSTDGGATWTTLRTDADGIWGIDFILPDTGWVVGVDSLSSTSDGGATWQTLGEPASGPLVAVQFSSAMNGVGLTKAGQLVLTSDGGTTWQTSSFTTPLTALCAAGQTVFASDAQGNVLRSSDSGATWATDHQTTIPAADGQVWSDLACDSTAAYHGMRVISQNLGGEAYLVDSRGASSWRAIASDPTNGPALAPGSPTADGFQTLGGIAVSHGKALIAGLPARGFSLGVAQADTPGSAPAAATFKSVPASAALDPLTTDPANFVRILGVSSTGNDAWVYLLDSAVQGTSPTYDTYVLASHDGGHTWSQVNDSGPLSQPQYP